MADYCIVYVTTPSLSVAQTIGKRLVEQKLAGCVNIIPTMHSIYRWKDAIETAEECVMLIKTEERLIDKINTMIHELHPYELPCVISLPITFGDEDYLNWISENLF